MTGWALQTSWVLCRENDGEERLEGAAGGSCPSGGIREAKEPELETEGLGTGETENELSSQRKEGCNVRLDLAM